MDKFHCKAAYDLENRIPSTDSATSLADFFKVFGDPTRLRILTLLQDAELCVHDIAKLLDMEQSAISHQLRVLRQSKLVKVRKEGKSSHYSLADYHVSGILGMGNEHIGEAWH